MLTMQPPARVAVIVAELEHLFVDRQALVHRLEVLTAAGCGALGQGEQASHGSLSLELERIIAEQTRLLSELATLHPPAGHAEG
jgi:hypothetical protein